MSSFCFIWASLKQIKQFFGRLESDFNFSKFKIIMIGFLWAARKRHVTVFNNTNFPNSGNLTVKLYDLICYMLICPASPKPMILANYCKPSTNFWYLIVFKLNRQSEAKFGNRSVLTANILNNRLPHLRLMSKFMSLLFHVV